MGFRGGSNGPDKELRMATDEAFWDKIADKYAADSAKPKAKGPNYAARLERASAVFSPSDAVLDVGCASGEITMDLAAHCGRIHGIDVGGRLIEIARAEAKRRGIGNVTFEKISADDPARDVPEGGFDAVTMYSVIHLVPEPAAFMRRLGELVRPGGYLISETPCLGDRSSIWRPVIGVVRWLGKAPSIVHCLKAAEVEAMVADAGFEVLDSQIYNPKSGQQSVIARRV